MSRFGRASSEPPSVPLGTARGMPGQHRSLGNRRAPGLGQVVIWAVTVLAASAFGCASPTPSMSRPSPSFAAGVRYNGRPFGLEGEASTWIADSDILGALGPLDGYSTALDLQGSPPLAYRVRDLAPADFIAVRRVPGRARTSLGRDAPTMDFPTSGWALGIAAEPHPQSLAPLCPYLRAEFKPNAGCPPDARPLGAPSPLPVPRP